MTVGARLGLFAVALLGVFGAAATAGTTIGPDRAEPGAEEGAHMSGSSKHSGGAHGAGGTDAVRGLGVADGGLRLVVDDAELRPGRSEPLRFRIVGADGGTIRDFDVEHERRMHAIVVRRDLTAFRHLHPKQGADGAWTAELRVPEPGSYRLFADFAAGGERYTLASDLRADGVAALRPLPAPEPIAVTDGGYEVRLETGPSHAGEEAELGFAVSKDGVRVRTEPYLGAGGHLVALREGDLAFLHVHPTREDGATVGFGATFPTAGRYRLFLQFKHEGRIETAAFTQEVI